MIKIYFIAGLPGETVADLDAIPRLCRELEDTLRETNRDATTIPRMTAGISCFVPKAMSPFERAPMDPENVLKGKLARITAGLKSIREMRYTTDNPRFASIQGIIAAGDRRLSVWFSESSEPGVQWKRILDRLDPSIRRSFPSPSPRRGPLPWEHLNISVN